MGDVRELLVWLSACLLSVWALLLTAKWRHKYRPRCPRCSSRRKTEYMGTSTAGRRVFTCNACPWWWTDPQ